MHAEIYEVTVLSPGLLPVPEPLHQRLRLCPGDILSVELLEACLRMEIYNEVLAARWDTKIPFHFFIRQFLERPLVALDGQGCLQFPDDLFALRSGERIVLNRNAQGGCNQIFLFRREELLR